MRTQTAVAALLMVAATMSPAVFAEPAARAQFHIQVVDDRNVTLPWASVTIYTLDGNPGVSVKADEHGVATFESVAPGMTQVVTRSGHFAPSIEKVTLQAGENSRLVMLHAPSVESE
jgi:hypothetical protein